MTIERVDRQLNEMLAEEIKANWKRRNWEPLESLPGSSDPTVAYRVAHDGWPMNRDRDRTLIAQRIEDTAPPFWIPKDAQLTAQTHRLRVTKYGMNARGQQDYKSWHHKLEEE